MVSRTGMTMRYKQKQGSIHGVCLGLHNCRLTCPPIALCDIAPYSYVTLCSTQWYQHVSTLHKIVSQCYVVRNCIMLCLFLCPTRVQDCAEDRWGELLVKVCFEQRLHLTKGSTSATGGMGPWGGESCWTLKHPDLNRILVLQVGVLLVSPRSQASQGQ